MTEINKGERQEDFAGALVKAAETSSSAVAAKAKAEVEAAYLVALHRPRSISQARKDMLDACHRSRFAEVALYTKPVGGGKSVTDFSIRGVESFLQSWGNVRVTQDVVYEDDDIRIVKIGLVDLERNISYENTVSIKKLVERKSSKDREVVSKRVNSFGDKVFVVKATEDEMANKVGSAISKSIRNHGLRIIPRDILDEARDAIAKTLTEGESDNSTYVKKFVDAFARIGVEPKDLEKYMGHALKTLQPAEAVELNGILQAIKDGEAKWQDYVDGPAKPERGTLTEADLGSHPVVTMGDLKPGKVEAHRDVSEPASGTTQEIPPEEAAEIKLEDIAVSILPPQAVDSTHWKDCRNLILKAHKVKTPVALSDAQWAALPTFLESDKFQKELRAENLLPMQR